MANTLTDDTFSEQITRLFRKADMPRKAFSTLRKMRVRYADNEAAVRMIDDHLSGTETYNAGWVTWGKINMGGPLFPDDDVRVMRVEGPDPEQVAYAAVLPSDQERIVNTPFVRVGA